MPTPTFRTYCLVLTVFFITGCNKDKNLPEYIPEGYYSGSFVFEGDTVFDAINFVADTFSEVPSGGVMYQKFPCIVEGIYSVQEDRIEFTILKYPSDDFNCDSEIFLSGIYEIVIAGDSLEFWKGDEAHYQVYKLKKVSSSR